MEVDALPSKFEVGFNGMNVEYTVNREKGGLWMYDLEDVIIGIDGGGTHTRVAVSDMQGTVLSYSEQGAASINKDAGAVQNVRQAIVQALKAAGREPRHVKGVAAGIAGYDEEGDREWVEQLTELEGLDCPKWHVNDAVVAHCGALLARPGIIVISGTGSILLAINEKGEMIRNYDFHHYAASAARFIAYDAVYEALARQTVPADAALIRSMLEHWEARSLEELWGIARNGFTADRRARDLRFGQFAPAVTEAALQGSPLARKVCDRAIDEMMVGIEMLAAAFSRDAVTVAFIGSVVGSPYFANRLNERLKQGTVKKYEAVTPQFSPVLGAVLMARQRLMLPVDNEVIANLNRWQRLQAGQWSS